LTEKTGEACVPAARANVNLTTNRPSGDFRETLLSAVDEAAHKAEAASTTPKGRLTTHLLFMVSYVLSP
jgi:hypothetical protein